MTTKRRLGEFSHGSFHTTTFFPKTVRDWNTLSSGLVETNSVVEFKELLSSTDTHM